MNAKLPIHHSRTFRIIENEEAWDTGEILSPAAWEKDAIWDQLSAIRALPHHSQFNFSYDRGEIPATSRKLPPGHINVVRIRFPVQWRLELFNEEFTQPNMHAGQTIQEAWALLHNDLPRLYPYATFNYAGFLQPSLTVTAEVIRENVTISFSFEVKDNGWITYRGHDTTNMTTRQEIYAQYAQDDPRIPPLAEYIEEDTRPYQNGDLISFQLKKFIEITDRSNEGPGRDGGDNGRKIILPPIVYQAAPINTTSPSNPKVQGSATGQIGKQTSDESDSFPTDSEEDINGYERRLARIHQAVHNHEPIMVIFVGEFQGYQDRISQCEFRLDYAGEAPTTMQEFFEVNWRKLCDISIAFGGETVPGSLAWTRNRATEDILIALSYRFGKGLKVRFQPKDLSGLPMSDFEATFVTDLSFGLSVAFPEASRLSDATLMQYMVNLTAAWDGTAYGMANIPDTTIMAKIRNR
jgi:hypothetical protein